MDRGFKKGIDSAGVKITNNPMDVPYFTVPDLIRHPAYFSGRTLGRTLGTPLINWTKRQM
jgi:hypothetical protein